MSTTTARKLTQAELIAEAQERFGEDRRKWAFQCPMCGDIATPADFRAAEADPGSIGQECIGRHLGALQGESTRGCDWAAYGLFRGPWFVTLPNGKEVASFPLAPNESAA